MKYSALAMLLALLIAQQGCKKKRENADCAHLVSPLNHSSFHSGDTVLIVTHLPFGVRQDSASCFIEIYNEDYSRRGTDTVIYPSYSYSNNYTCTTAIVFRTDSNKVDSFSIGPSVGNVTAGLFCVGITIYIQP